MIQLRKGSGIKPIESADQIEIFYDPNHWSLLETKRRLALSLMNKLAKNNISSILYGSICRGDISESSDIDIFIPYLISSFQIESALLKENLNIYEKRIVQATPKHLIKGHIYLDELTCVTFPLTSIREREFEFIKFGGSLLLDQLKEGKRVPGVDKRLILVDPTEKGHIESPIVGFESIVAKKIGVDIELVKERIRILTTRDKKGRTGVYLNIELAADENFEEVFKQLKDRDPVIRRRSNL